MILFNRLISWTAAVLIFFIFQSLIQVDQLYQLFIIIALLNLIVILSLWQLTGRSITKSAFWNFLITPIILINSGWLFLIFLEGYWLQQLVLLIISISIFIFLKVVFLYLSLRPKYQAHALENISSYLNLITIFLFNSSLFNLLIFLNISLWSSLISSMVVVGLLSYQLFWTSDILLLTAWRYLVIITLITGELFLTVSFLPTSIYVNGLIITLSYYIMAGVSRNWLLQIKEKKVIKRYLLIGGIALIIILITAKWI